MTWAAGNLNRSRPENRSFAKPLPPLPNEAGGFGFGALGSGWSGGKGEGPYLLRVVVLL